MKIEEFERSLTRFLEALLSMGLFAIFVMILILVALRYVFQSGLVGANETATILFIYLSSLGSAVAISRNEHIRIDLLSKMLDSHWKLYLETSILLLVILINVVITERSLLWITSTGSALMPATQLPRYVAQISVPLGCSLAIIFCCTRIMKLYITEPSN